MYIVFNTIKFQEHGLYFNIVVLPHAHELGLQLIYFSILFLLTFYKDYRMIERFLHEMSEVVFSKDLNFATQVIVRALDLLVFTLIFMFIYKLPLDLLPALVVAINYFVETTLVMGWKIFIDDYCCAFLIRAINPAKVTKKFVRVHFFTL